MLGEATERPQQLHARLLFFPLGEGLFRFCNNFRDVVALGADQPLNPRFHLTKFVVFRFHRSADDQRSSRLVDQDRVDFIDNRIVMFPLHQLLGSDDHVIPEIVEAEFIVGAVSNIGPVLLPALDCIHLRLDASNR